MYIIWNAFKPALIKEGRIDYRCQDNPGGDLNEVVAIADRLVPEGLIVYMEDRAGNRMENFG